MRDDVMSLRVAALFLANQPPGARSKARKMTTPINPPRGIDRSIVRENGEAVAAVDEAVDPHSRDITPKDVFNPTPNNTSVLNLAQTGKDLSKALDKQVPKDKGHDSVSNLSQYLIRTEGGGSGSPAGKK
jgi:hypothetical protein